MNSTIYFAISLVAAAVCLVLDILGVVKCRKKGEEVGNRLMLECILHTMLLIVLVVLVVDY